VERRYLSTPSARPVAAILATNDGKGYVRHIDGSSQWGPEAESVEISARSGSICVKMKRFLRDQQS